MSRSLIHLLVLLLPILGHLDAVYSSESIMFNKCGEGLSNLMIDLCINGFNTHFSHKRASSMTDLNLFDYVDNMVDSRNEEVAVIKPHHPRLSSLMATRRLSRLIADECCAKKCSFSEIMAYCH
ncbi:probable insulin-like peptide 3 [Drosophila kikkawai]|uniref:Probable insulin-like peptide 3 n=1 Tax=Drosophila kikkawai TaxID=30033 RepID=A0A6P4IHB4_DROKI|nr:probable insulin-like peptide 5 [Drosophila kikkawai]